MNFLSKAYLGLVYVIDLVLKEKSLNFLSKVYLGPGLCDRSGFKREVIELFE